MSGDDLPPDDGALMQGMKGRLLWAKASRHVKDETVCVGMAVAGQQRIREKTSLDWSHREAIKTRKEKNVA